MMDRSLAETVRAIDELWSAKTPATVRSIANALRIDDGEADQRLQVLLSNGYVRTTPLQITVLAGDRPSAETAVFWLMHPDAILYAEEILGRWSRSE
jgi:predicted ArsR family transcriptional regulator